ncbi:transcription termination factor Rho [Corynebacterium halotolerans]|uniref:Transcription termination factor Rho n=1 Tax=Corynebacterium halotolerans YIM 70093 = DSM 44683 TaxID=1121362 RepID=M1NRV0_9CORY|nr:transcription termination factor Rho [Corynebacterium halotolerans]AGF72227.1 transcription termination factor Rho [Corynebacterium halotolerans YIM 70093 = DSM 44683]
MGGADQANLSALRLPELRKIAAEKGLKGISGLRKGELISAIQSGVVPKAAKAAKSEPAAAGEETAGQTGPVRQEPQEQAGDSPAPRRRRRATTTTEETSGSAEATAGTADTGDAGDAGRDENKRDGQRNDSDDSDSNSGNEDGDGEQRYESRSAARRARRNRARHGQREQGGDKQDSRDKQDSDKRDSGKQDSRDKQDSGQDDGGQGNRRGRNRGGEQDNHHNDGEGRRGRRNRRNRRNNRGDNQGHDGGDRHDNQQGGDNTELQDVAGILDVVDNNTAFVRTTGYHASPADVFVPNQLIRRFGLRGGDAITGQVKVGGSQTHGQGRNRRKYNQLVRVDSVNGMDVESAKGRPDFSKLTPLYPNQRLRLETEQKVLTTRVIDLIMPIGKGQRALIVSPPKAGKTTILQNIANAISTNNPECYLMVVLVDERPEEVTDMQRSVKGEVIASTFDRPPGEHTAVAELAIERAKRLVEQGKDVVVLLDSITRLGRAYNNSSPASGRILSGGVDSNALYPPKRFLGAACNIENGGSLTIIATAMVETGSAGDTVIFEEFKGTGNAELKLDRKISERRVFPAVDVNPSGTRKDELLLAPDEARVMHKLRRILSALDPQQAIDLLIKQLKKTKSNGEFLMQVASSAPMAADKDEEDYS